MAIPLRANKGTGTETRRTDTASRSGILLHRRESSVGVPLEPGERVIYFRSVAQWGGRIFRIVAGIALAPFIVGLVILYAVFKDMPGEPDAQAITTRRLLAMKSGGKIIAQVRWEEVAGFTKMLRSRAAMTMAVRNAQGPPIEFAEDGRWLEQALPAWQRPENREASPEVPFV